MNCTNGCGTQLDEYGRHEGWSERGHLSTDDDVRFCRGRVVERLRAMEAEVARVRGLIDRDRTGLAEALDRVRAECRARLWVQDGRGPYRWDDDRYKAEAGRALRKVIEIANEALKASGRLADDAFHPERG